MFTREIKKDFSEINEESFIHPVEGKLVTYGKVVKGQTYLVKGKNYSVEELIGSSDNLENYFFYNYYLSPQDYHRVHHPVSGVFKMTKFIHGPLYPVAPWFVNLVPAVFSKNARTVSLVESETFGSVYTVMVGALNVGSLRMLNGFFSEGDSRVKSGDTLGVFELGSSVVVFTKKELSVSEGSVFFEELN